MNWYSGTIPEAVAEAKRNNKLFLVYIEGTDEMSQSMTTTYNEPSVATKLSSDNIIALKLVANSVPYMQFCAIYPVLVIPSSFFIGGNGAPIEIITGSLSPTEFSSKIDKVFETYQKSSGQKTETKSPLTASSVKAETEVSIPSTSDTVPSFESAPFLEEKIDRAKAEKHEMAAEEDESSESTPSLEEKIERAKALVEAQRQKKAVEENEKERQQELERRNMGKAMQQAEKSKHDTELQEWAKNRAKEKEEERLAREKVKAMIAQDRAERAAKYQHTKEMEQAENDRLARQREEAERASRNAAMSSSNDARIQFRLPDGSYTTHSFSADSSLEEARRFVIEEVRPPFSNFSLCTTFPRRHFTESNYSESLRDLQLAPSAVLLILPAQAVSSVSQGTGFLTSLFWMVLSPLRNVWSLIRSMFTGGSQEPPTQPTPSSSSSAQQSARTNPAPDNSNSQPPNQRKESSFAKREGNIFRINNQSDDDENNTWNGNSTQQM